MSAALAEPAGVISFPDPVATREMIRRLRESGE
jgi:hypothetical protein